MTQCKWLAGFALAALLSAGCQGNNSPKVVCTTGMVADMARNIGGPHIEVEQIMGADVDPHLYKATPGDMRKLSQAKVIFYSGLHLEGKMTDVLHSLGEKMPCVGIAEKLPKDKILQSDGVPDPHVWFDVSLWSQTATAVRDTLVKFDPAHADDYRKRTDAYQAELAKLHEYAKTRIASVPEARRVMVTSHDAFRYFGRAYGIEVKGIQGISTDAEASVKDINDLVQFISSRKVKAVFVETSVNPRNMQALRDGCKAAGHSVELGGELFSDAMGKADTPEGTYAGMIRHNVETVVKALE